MKTSGLQTWLLAGLILLLTFVAFLPALQNSFVNWDDHHNLIENQNYRGLGWSNIRWMFTTFHHTLYRPLTWLSFAVDYLVWEMQPFGYHLSSLLIHSANAVLFYFIALRLLLLAVPENDASQWRLRLGAGLAALFFSLHPLRVEAVAWASARNDVVSAAFFLLALLCYLRAADGNARSQRSIGWRIAATASYAASLLAKGAGMTLPITLVALDIYPLKRLKPDPRTWFQPQFRHVWWEKLPLLLLAVGAGVLGFMAKYELGSMQSLAQADISARLGQTLYGLVFYLWKTVVPVELSPLYERPIDLSALDLASIRSGIIVLVITVCVCLMRRRWPALLVSWIYYVVVLIPVTGVIQSGPQLAADRYAYLPCLSLAVLAGGWTVYLWRLRQSGRLGYLSFGVTQTVAAVILIGWGVLTWEQTKIWRDSVTLWRHALSVTPTAMVHYNLGSALELAGQTDGAIKHIRQATELYPFYADAHYSLGKILARRGELDEAERNYRRALELNPKDEGAYNGLGLIFVKKGQMDKAIEYFRYAVEINPSNAGTLNNLAIASAGRGDVEEAIRHFRRALKINPGDPATHSNMARALLQNGDSVAAVEHLRRALELNPNDGEVHKSLAMIFAREGRLDGAIDHFRRALEKNPEDAGLRANMAVTLAKQGDLEGAKKAFQEALRIQPDFAEAHAGLARTLRLQGRTNEAVRHYQEALRLLKLQRDTAGGR